MMARWLSIIDSYDFEMQYRPWNKHLNADGLSRIVPRRCKNESCVDCAEKNFDCIDAESEVGDEHFDLNQFFHKDQTVTSLMLIKMSQFKLMTKYLCCP